MPSLQWNAPYVRLSEFLPIWIWAVSSQLGVRNVRDLSFSGHPVEAHGPTCPSAVRVNFVIC